MRRIICLYLFKYSLGFSNCHKSRWANEDITRYNNENIQKFSIIGEVPRSDVLFRLWTHSQKNVFAPLYVGQLGIEDTIRPEQPFKLIIHGWTDCADSDWYDYFKNEYLSKGDYNVIMVDWSKPASALYPLSAVYTTDVGKYVGELIVDLHKTYNISLTNVHLIGHSLGAHISGYAGKYVKEQTGIQIGRITALDPAGPLFLLSGCNKRLCKTDAEFLDVIHTDGGKLGYNGAIGHADFYPNGGTAPQKGCVLFGIVDAGNSFKNIFTYIHTNCTFIPNDTRSSHLL